MTPSNVTMLMRQIRVGRQEAQRIFPNIRFANVPNMERYSSRQEEAPGRAYSPDHKYDDNYSLDMEANDRGD